MYALLYLTVCVFFDLRFTHYSMLGSVVTVVKNGIDIGISEMSSGYTSRPHFILFEIHPSSDSFYTNTMYSLVTPHSLLHTSDPLYLFYNLPYGL